MRPGFIAGLALFLALAGCSETAAPRTGTSGPTSEVSQPSSPSRTTAASAPPTSPQPATSPQPSTPTCRVPDRLRGRDIETLPVTSKVVALTFDGGANAAGVPSILTTLGDRHVPATFFLTGQFARTFPRLSARIARSHLVGNHTDTHPDLTTLSDTAITREVRAAQRSILAVTGEDPRRFFRFPFGARTAHEITLLNRLCYVPFRWTVDTLGWQGTSGGITVGTVVSRVMAAARPGAIVLMHVGAHPRDGSTLDADALPTVIRRLRQRGYTLVTLSRIMKPAP